MNMLKAGNDFKEIIMASYQVNHLLDCSMKLYWDCKIMKQAIMFRNECCSTRIQLYAKKLQLSNDTATQCSECIP